MASNLKLGATARNAACDGIVDLLNSGTIAVRTGAPPANPSDASSGTLLGTLTLGATAFGDAAAGVATANAITSDSDADASGDAGYFRVYASGAADTACAFQGTAGLTTDTVDMDFGTNKTIVVGGVIAVSSFTVTVPEQ